VRGEQGGQPGLARPGLPEHQQLEFEDGHPQAIPRRGRRLGVHVDDRRGDGEAGQQILGGLAEMAPAAGVEQNPHPRASGLRATLVL